MGYWRCGYLKLPQRIATAAGAVNCDYRRRFPHNIEKKNLLQGEPVGTSLNFNPSQSSARNAG